LSQCVRQRRSFPEPFLNGACRGDLPPVCQIHLASGMERKAARDEPDREPVTDRGQKNATAREREAERQRQELALQAEIRREIRRQAELRVAEEARSRGLSRGRSRGRDYDSGLEM